jgi:multidrug efflux pump subunit AcrA (membrane-fusion protein)
MKGGFIMYGMLNLLVFLSLASGTDQEAPQAGKGNVHVVQQGRFTAVWKGDGKFLPARAEELLFKPKAYKGALKVLEVVKAGTLVKKGDLLVRFDAESIDEQIEKSRLDLKAAKQQLADAEVKLRLAEMDLEAQRERDEMDLRHAELRLKGYREVEKKLDADNRALSRMYQENSLEDQQDELDQLGKMYEEDELTEETEELVLKRGIRNLKRSMKSFDLSKRREEYNLEYTESPRLERMVSDVQSKKRGLQRLMLQGDYSVVLADIALERARMSMEKLEKHHGRLLADRESMEMESPTDGILIHGSRDLTGNALKEGKTAATQDPFLTVAGPGALEVRFDLAEKDYFKLEKGMAVKCLPTARPSSPFEGTLTIIKTLPDAQGNWECRAGIEGSHEVILPGMTCKVEVVYRDIKDVLLVPVRAVKRKRGRLTATWSSGTASKKGPSKRANPTRRT